MDKKGRAVDEAEKRVLEDDVPVDIDAAPNFEDSDSGPAFGVEFGRVDISNESLETKAIVTEDGRINIKFAERRRRYSNAIPIRTASDVALQLPTATKALLDRETYDDPPPLNICIQIIGSRGDIQPFIALGKALLKYGHNVRVATHPTFRTFVKENGLDFFSVGGDPAELIMVRNPGLIPGLESIRAGDIGARRKNIWLSCISPCEDSDVPFLADAIIANPPSYAHIHCAEKLGIPLHLMFTMPWSPTHEFPHPLANVSSTNMEPNTTNLMTYPMVDLLTWQGLGDVVNKFRRNVLRAEELNPVWAPSLLQRAKIPYTYCWSPALIPKPPDWGAEIDISGFFFLDLANDYQPPDKLAAFLAAGPPPVYIGFGSIVVKNPAGLTKLIFDAVHKLGIRALVSEGWGGLGAGSVPEGVFMLGNCPHDWLFKQVSAVVHHGGAGTTAIGLRLGKPTVIVPFFGDQAFWARMVHAAGAGPEPQPFKLLTAERLANAIQVALAPEATTAAAKLSERMSTEDGALTAAQSFHRMLPLKKMRCAVFPKKLAVWKVRRTDILISSYVAIILLENKYLKAKDLKPYISRLWAYISCKYWRLEVNDGPWDPLAGAAGSLISSMGSIAAGVGTAFAAPPRALYAIAAKKCKKGSDSETSSLRLSMDSVRNAPQSEGSSTIVSSPLNKPLSDYSGGSDTSDTLKKAQSDQSRTTQSRPRKLKKPNFEPHVHREDSVEYKNMKKQLGQQGFGKALKGLVQAPIDFSMAIAQGFHNLPMLYGQSVRHVDPVVDFSSGVKAGGKQFGLGFYDGITGFFMDPIKGAQQNGGLGFLKGLGSGTLDLVVKASAGLWALPAYTLKGMTMASRNHKYRNEFNGIFGKRFVVGLEEFRNSTHEEKQEVLRIWTEKGFKSRVTERGELKDDFFTEQTCPLQTCKLREPHTHPVVGLEAQKELDEYA